MCPQECGLHCRGDADPEASVGRVRSHGGHFQDRHAAHEAHAARGRVRLLQGLPAAGVRGGEVAADGGRPAVPPLRAGQLLKSSRSPSPSFLSPYPLWPAPPPGSPASTTSAAATTAATVVLQGSASPQLPAMPSITSVCLAKRDARLFLFDLRRGKTKTAVLKQEQETRPEWESALRLKSPGTKHSFTVAEPASRVEPDAA